MRHQFVPKRWCTTIQVLIEKDKGRPKIDRLRTIQLVEADSIWSLKQSLVVALSTMLMTRVSSQNHNSAPVLGSPVSAQWSLKPLPSIYSTNYDKTHAFSTTMLWDVMTALSHP
jgi:hypothetical protein